MRSTAKILALLWVAFILVAERGLCVSPQSGASRSTSNLKELVSAAQAKSGWPALRKFAESALSPEVKGQSYFALGYFEFQGKDFDAAISDLKTAAATQFQLADYAEFYAALSASSEKQTQAPIDILDGFSSRYPESVLRLDALVLLANSLLSIGQPQRALELLKAEPEAGKRPRLETILGRAQEAAGKLSDAARSFQQIYCEFPTSPQARAAQDELHDLRARLGPKYPDISDGAATDRAETLMERGRYCEALNDLTLLLRKTPDGTRASQWKVDRARCLFHLRQPNLALDELQPSLRASPEADADRLAALVEIYIQRENQDSADLIVSQLGKLYPKSQAYSSALDAEGNHFVRRGDWATAARYYSPLAQSFSDTPLGEEAAWRVAWNNFLQKDIPKARQVFADFATRYPKSWHGAGALYWLGRLAEAEGGLSEAREFYKMVKGRWGQSYFAQVADRRLTALEPRLKGLPEGSPSDSLASRLAQQIPPPSSTIDTCPPAQALPILGQFSALTSIGLNDLALDNLRTLARERPTSSVLYLSLSGFEAQMDQFNPSVIDAVRAIPHYYDYDLGDLSKEAWNLLYPTEYWDLVQRNAQANSIDPYLVMALIRQESAFDADIRSSANARGLMQVLPRTLKTRRNGRRAPIQRLYDPEFNVQIGTGILQDALQVNQGVYERAMAAYHAGQGRVDAWLRENSFSEPAEFMESIPIPATRIYVERVVRDAAIYRKLLTGSPAFKKCN